MLSARNKARPGGLVAGDGAGDTAARLMTTCVPTISSTPLTTTTATTTTTTYRIHGEEGLAHFYLTRIAQHTPPVSSLLSLSLLLCGSISRVVPPPAWTTNKIGIMVAFSRDNALIPKFCGGRSGSTIFSGYRLYLCRVDHKSSWLIRRNPDRPAFYQPLTRLPDPWQRRTTVLLSWHVNQLIVLRPLSVRRSAGPCKGGQGSSVLMEEVFWRAIYILTLFPYPFHTHRRRVGDQRSPRHRDTLNRGHHSHNDNQGIYIIREDLTPNSGTRSLTFAIFFRPFQHNPN